MKVNAELDLKSETTKGDLIAALDGVPNDAVISIQRHIADRFGVDTYSLKLTWEVGNGKTVFNGHVHKPGCRCIQGRGQSEGGAEL